MPVINLPYRIERPIHGTSIGMSVYAKWKTLPVFLHELKRMDITIHKAKMHNDWTTMYLKTSGDVLLKTNALERVLTGNQEVDEVPLYLNKLCPNTQIFVYNITTFPYTVMDFNCQDRTGLMCEILEFLAPFDIEVRGAYVNTIGSIATNMFYITRHGEKLKDEYIEYISNLMEYELKKTNDNPNSF